MSLFIPENYSTPLDNYDMQNAIDKIRANFQNELSKALNLKRVSAPLFVRKNIGINDDLTGKERPVSFDIPALDSEVEVVQSLAKWKRVALKRYNFHDYKGLWTDMNAIRRDEQLDNLHSIYVDQWDWEKIIHEEDRNLEYLKDTVRKIAKAIYNTQQILKKRYPNLKTNIKKDVYFITSQKLEDMYPNLNAKQRENEIVRKYKTVFIIGIGDKLKSGKAHDFRAPDYDDWNLNGDLLYYHKPLDCALEISSMGIRVNPETLKNQLVKAKKQERINLQYHQALLNNELPQTIGGGIGQSRLCMLLIGCAHVGEVQSSVWRKGDIDKCSKKGIRLL